MAQAANIDVTGRPSPLRSEPSSLRLIFPIIRKNVNPRCGEALATVVGLRENRLSTEQVKESFCKRNRWGKFARAPRPIAFALIALVAASPALGKTIVSCGGAVLLGGAQLLCSHVDPTAPAQVCTFSWALATAANQTQVVEGSFLIPPGTSNFMAYQGSGFVRALSEPIVLCQGRRGGG